jgi:transcription antitermination factor NusG
MHPYANEVMPYGWYATYTRHQHEKSVALQLSNKGLEVLLPLYRSLSRWKDRSQSLLLPLFPSYVFVRASLGQKLEVLRTPGVCWLVASAGVPIQIPSKEVKSLEILCQTVAPFEPHPFLECGDPVRVVRGPLTGVEGMLVRARNHCRVVISVRMLERSASVEVDIHNLEKVSVPRLHSVLRPSINCQEAI